MTSQNFHLPEGIDITGKLSLFLSTFLFVLDKLTIAEINQWVLLISAIIGLGYIVVKTASAIIEFKIKRQEYKKIKNGK
jgi:hypothetical protein